MDRIEELENIIVDVKPLKAVFIIKKDAKSACISISAKHHRVMTGAPYKTLDALVHDSIQESFDSKLQKYIINVDQTFERCIIHIKDEIVKLTNLVSPAKRPEQTKLVKVIRNILRRNSTRRDVSDSKVIEHFINIYLYYMTNLDEIKTDSSCNHGKNILGLLINISNTY